MQPDSTTNAPLCKCGCGQSTHRITRGGPRRGQFYDYCLGHARRRDATTRFWAFVVQGPDCWTWRGAKHDFGYGLLKGYNRRNEFAYRFSWMIHNGPIPQGLQVLHKCIGQPECTNPRHLYLGTQADNMRDVVAQRRGNWGNARGIRNGNARLTTENILAIRQRYAVLPISMAALGLEFHVCATTICRIVNRRAWRHIP